MNDPRLTKTGRILRKYKLDELPTLVNLLKGDISVVGPRPDTPEEIASLDEETRNIVLSVKPGIVSPATLWDFNEDIILKDSDNPHRDYCEKIKPVKYRMNVEYVKSKSFLGDIKLICQLIVKIFVRK